jgi:hypothetical protein
MIQLGIHFFFEIIELWFNVSCLSCPTWRSENLLLAYYVRSYIFAELFYKFLK